MVACKNDSDCETAKCQYCTSAGFCNYLNGAYKINYKLGLGDGICYHGDCPSNLTCGYNNFIDYHPQLYRCSSVAKYLDVCEEPGIYLNDKDVQYV